MRTSNITKQDFKDLLTDELIDEILYSEWEENPHEKKCINIGDPIMDAISNFKKAKQKKHRLNLIVKTAYMSEEQNQILEGISSDNQRLM